MPSSELILGIDVGTTNLKCLALDAGGTIVAHASEPTPHLHPHPGWTDFDADVFWKVICRNIRAVVAQVPNRDAIKAVATASVAESLVPVGAQGQTLAPSIAWFDLRTTEEYRWLCDNVGYQELFNITGVNPDPVFGLCKVLWIKNHQPDVFAQTRHWLHFADYMAFRLCGVAATDPSLASRSLAYDLRQGKWADELLEKVGVSPSTFPPVRPSGFPLGTLTTQSAAETNLPPNTLVCVGIHDHPGGAFAVGGLDPDVLFDSIGTSESLNRLIPEPIMDARIAERGLAQGSVWTGRQPEYFITGGLQTAGAAVEWFRHEIGGRIDFDTLSHEAAKAMGAVPVFLPHLIRSSTPYPDFKSAAAFVGLKSSTTRGAMFRAVLEGLAFEARAIADAMEVDAGLARCQRVVTIGSTLENPLLSQLKSDAYKVPVRVSPVREATSLGAALLAGIGSGLFADAAAAVGAVRREEIVYEPDPANSAALETRYQEVYKDLYNQLQTTHHHLYVPSPSIPGQPFVVDAA